MDTSLIQPPTRRSHRRHSPEFRASVIEAAKQPGVSIAAVALANGLNANMLRKWVSESMPDRVLPVPRGGVDTAARAAFVPVTLAAPVREAAAPVSTDIRVEVRRGATVVSISWPSGSAEACGAWLRELLR